MPMEQDKTIKRMDTCLATKASDRAKLQQLLCTGIDCAQIRTLCTKRREMEFYSDALWRMLGYSDAKEFKKVTADEWLASVAQTDLSRVQTEILHAGRQASYQLEYHMQGKDGRLLLIRECGQRVHAADGSARYSAVLTDITPLKDACEHLLYQVSYDELTGIYNKAAFYEEARKILKAQPKKEFELMRIDVERFKVINDLFGEATGNRLLQYIARFFQHVNLQDCVYGRMHSDNFMLLYPSTAANRRRFITSLQTMAASYSLDYRIVLCFGVYQIEDRGLPLSAMCDRAGMALQKAKLNGLLVCGEYDEDMRQEIVKEQAIVNDMNEALEREEFILYLQPKFELSTEKIVGAEALVRWQHPTRGIVPPADFIPVFERNGFIFKLDKYIWEKTCALLRSCLDAGRNPMPLSVNVSRVDLNSTGIVQIFEQLVEKYDIPPHLLELELTESAYMDNPQQIIEIAKELQQRGFKILMDDFGSGYSSLNMLKDMPVDILKIDLQFLDSKDKSDRGGNILNSVVRMAKWLHIPVIAEGVETRQQADFLRTIGCNYVQGYYYSRPVSITAYEELVARNDYHPDLSSLQLDAADTEELLNPNAQFNLLFNSVTGGLGLYELSERGLELLRANDGYFEMLGIARSALYDKGMQVLENVHAEDREAFLQAIRGTTKYGEITQCRLRRWRADGRLLWLHVRVSLVSKEESRQLIYLAMEDITELQQANLHMQALFDHMPGGVGIYELKDDVLRTVLFSRWLYKINGMKVQQFAVENQEDLQNVLPETFLSQLKREIIRSYEEKRTVYLTYPFLTAAGKQIYIRGAFNTLLEADRYRCYALLQDVTEEKQCDE